ncbi:MAG: PHP domain-containing protein [Desulfovibrionaceae bacterium]|nr:PHP domain-containing protein [Desulfovibrionaceae bacterium]
MKLIDLHTHTMASDGTDSPEELVSKAHEAGLVAIAITDHDCLDGLDEARRAGEACGLKVIGGCELSARTEHGEIHILGLWLPQDAAELQEKLTDLRRRRCVRNEIIVEKLRALGFAIHMDEVRALARGSVGRPHIARVLVSKGYVRDEREAFRKYLAYGCKAWVAKDVLEPEEAVRLLAGLGATVCLAHPFIQGYPVPWLESLVQQMIPYGLSALEAWHSEHTDAQTRLCVDWARRYDLGLSGGSDYHGQNKPGIRLGVGRGGLRVPLDVLERLEARRRAQGLPC